MFSSSCLAPLQAGTSRSSDPGVLAVGEKPWPRLLANRVVLPGLLALLLLPERGDLRRGDLTPFGLAVRTSLTPGCRVGGGRYPNAAADAGRRDNPLVALRTSLRRSSRSATSGEADIGTGCCRTPWADQTDATLALGTSDGSDEDGISVGAEVEAAGRRTFGGADGGRRLGCCSGIQETCTSCADGGRWRAGAVASWPVDDDT